MKMLGTGLSNAKKLMRFSVIKSKEISMISRLVQAKVALIRCGQVWLEPVLQHTLMMNMTTLANFKGAVGLNMDFLEDNTNSQGNKNKKKTTGLNMMSLSLQKVWVMKAGRKDVSFGKKPKRRDQHTREVGPTIMRLSNNMRRNSLMNLMNSLNLTKNNNNMILQETIPRVLITKLISISTS